MDQRLHKLADKLVGYWENSEEYLVIDTLSDYNAVAAILVYEYMRHRLGSTEAQKLLQAIEDSRKNSIEESWLR